MSRLLRPIYCRLSISCAPISRTVAILSLLVIVQATAVTQSRIMFNSHPLFLSGSNVAWISFAADIGAGETDLALFSAMFDSVHAAGGNVMRLWLHTNGAYTPAFDSTGRVVGPGTNAVSDLQAIVQRAWERKVGLILCLWSFDMLRESFGTAITDRAYKLMTDTASLGAYIDNALIPVVQSLKGHPGVVAWEAFNEAEGMSEECGWLFTRHVPMSVIQRAVNRMAAAIHRTDPNALVTTGAWSFAALSDVTLFKKTTQPPAQQPEFSPDERRRIETEFLVRYGTPMSTDEIVARFSTLANTNYYRDDRLIAAGGDPAGVLDFYSVHYYSWGGTGLSPFHHPVAQWKLSKPVVVAEFYLVSTYGIDYGGMFELLYSNGYAGALTWSWQSEALQRVRTSEVMRALFARHPRDVDPAPASGTIYAFTGSPSLIGVGDPSLLSWQTAVGSAVTLNGNPVTDVGSMTVSPDTTTEYVLLAQGTASDTVTVRITVVPWGTIVPAGFALHQNFPNPVNPTTTFRIDLPRLSEVRLIVYSMLGQEVARLVDAELAPGRYLFPWYATVASGAYVCRMEVVPRGTSGPKYAATRKFVVVR